MGLKLVVFDIDVTEKSEKWGLGDRRGEGVDVMRDKEWKIEKVESSHKIGGTGEDWSVCLWHSNI